MSNPAGVLAAFSDGVKVFNANTDPTIGGHLAQNVTVNSYDHTPYSGIAAVVGYFTQEFKKHAQFTPTVRGHNVTGASGKVWGYGTWVSDSSKQKFNFEFQFIFEDAQWLFLNLDCYKLGNRGADENDDSSVVRTE